MKVVLVGFMGSGKSTVGRLLSSELFLPFVDLDEVIVEKTGLSIPDIFKLKGETGFREIERELLADILSREERGLVLSTGGGAPAYRDNMELINRYATSVFLYADLNTIYSRILGDTNRPLASLGKEQLKELYRKRLPFYRKAHFTVDTFGKSPEEVTRKVISLLNGGKGKTSR